MANGAQSAGGEGLRTALFLAWAALLAGCGSSDVLYPSPGEEAGPTDVAVDAPADVPAADVPAADVPVTDVPAADSASDDPRLDDPRLDVDASDLALDPDIDPGDTVGDLADGSTSPSVCTAEGVRGECLTLAECDGGRDWVAEGCPDSFELGCCTDSAAIRCTVDGRPGECIHVDECTGDRAPTPGYCPGPAEIQCCTERPAGECDPGVMPQPNTGLTEAPGIGGCPDGMAPVDDFCIDRYEAALLEVLPGGEMVPWSPYFNPGERRIRAVSIRGAVPQGYITGSQAERACLEAGKRLCFDDEWLRACGGLDGNAYPYGPEPIAGACNENRVPHPAIEYFGTDADWIWSQLGHPCINQLEASLDQTAGHAECVSPEGVYDLVGNLHEWTADPAGTFRGGYYVDTWRNGLGCNYVTTAHNREHWDYSTGFRCCAD